MPSKTVTYPLKNGCQKYLISADDYQRMGEAGIFEGKPRVELIDGEILALSSFTSYHSSHVDKIALFFTINLSGKANIRTQGSVRLDQYSEPEPDIALLRLREDFYNEAHPAPEDIYLLIEVAVKSLEKDRSLKLEKFARSNIPEYWIVIPDKGVVEVYRKPEDGVFLEKNTYRKADEWMFEAFDLKVEGSDLLV